VSDGIDDEDLETPDERRRHLADLFEWWDAFYEAATPVSQADALLGFSNAMFHFRWNVEREWARDATATDEP
jgi:hypothetical protein